MSEREWDWPTDPHVAQARSSAAGSDHPDPEGGETHHLHQLRRGAAADTATSAQREHERLDVRRFGGAGHSNEFDAPSLPFLRDQSPDDWPAHLIGDRNGPFVLLLVDMHL